MSAVAIFIHLRRSRKDPQVVSYELRKSWYVRPGESNFRGQLQSRRIAAGEFPYSGDQEQVYMLIADLTLALTPVEAAAHREGRDAFRRLQDDDAVISYHQAAID